MRAQGRGVRGAKGGGLQAAGTAAAGRAGWGRVCAGCGCLPPGRGCDGGLCLLPAAPSWPGCALLRLCQPLPRPQRMPLPSPCARARADDLALSDLPALPDDTTSEDSDALRHRAHALSCDSGGVAAAPAPAPAHPHTLLPLHAVHAVPAASTPAPSAGHQHGSHVQQPQAPWAATPDGGAPGYGPPLSTALAGACAPALPWARAALQSSGGGAPEGGAGRALLGAANTARYANAVEAVLGAALPGMRVPSVAAAAGECSIEGSIGSASPRWPYGWPSELVTAAHAAAHMCAHARTRARRHQHHARALRGAAARCRLCSAPAGGAAGVPHPHGLLGG